MFEFICLFFPSVICLRNNLETYNNKIEIIVLYCKYNILINLLVMIMYYIINRGKVVLVDKDLFTLKFSLEYLLLATPLAIILPLIIDVIKKNIQIRVEVIKNEKN